MRKVIAGLALLSIMLSFVSCKSKKGEITCEDVIRVYEDAGYDVIHSAHSNGSGWVCSVSARKNMADPDSDYIFFAFYESELEAKQAKRSDKYNFAKWLFGIVMGEGRWLKAKRYGNIEYVYYSAKMSKPFKGLTK